MKWPSVFLNYGPGILAIVIAVFGYLHLSNNLERGVCEARLVSVISNDRASREITRAAIARAKRDC